MNTNELISELEKQKEILLDGGFFNQELLEKYLNKSFLRKQNDNVKPEDIKAEIILSGINSPSTLQKQLTRIYPYNTSKPNFTRIHSSWNTLYTITHNPYEKFHISIHVPTQNKQKQKIFKQDKAA